MFSHSPLNRFTFQTFWWIPFDQWFSKTSAVAFDIKRERSWDMGTSCLVWRYVVALMSVVKLRSIMWRLRNTSEAEPENMWNFSLESTSYQEQIQIGPFVSPYTKLFNQSILLFLALQLKQLFDNYWGSLEEKIYFWKNVGNMLPKRSNNQSVLVVVYDGLLIWIKFETACTGNNLFCLESMIIQTCCHLFPAIFQYCMVEVTLFDKVK